MYEITDVARFLYMCKHSTYAKQAERYRNDDKCKGPSAYCVLSRLHGFDFYVLKRSKDMLRKTVSMHKNTTRFRLPPPLQ